MFSSNAKLAEQEFWVSSVKAESGFIKMDIAICFITSYATSSIIMTALLYYADDNILY